MSIDIDAIEARVNAATPGPWEYVDTEDGLFGVEMDAGHNVLWDMEGTCDRCFGNMRFIAAARQDVPALCAEVRELRAANERLLLALKECQAALYGARELIGNIGNIGHAVELADKVLK